jgi:hypothetical protein
VPAASATEHSAKAAAAATADASFFIFLPLSVSDFVPASARSPSYSGAVPVSSAALTISPRPRY